MTSKHLLVTICVFLFAFFVFGCTQKPAQPSAANLTSAGDEAENLYLSSLLVGKGREWYTYSYEENRTGYTIRVTVEKGRTRARITEYVPLSKRTVYLLENSTVLCIKLKSEDEVCANAEGSADVVEYVGQLRGFMFNDTMMLEGFNESKFLADNGFLTFENATREKTLPLGNCTGFNFAIDYSRLTIEEMSGFGRSLSSPMFFSGYFCVDSSSGHAYEKYFNYTFRNVPMYTHFRLLSYDFDTEPVIQQPSNVSSRLASTIIEEEKEKTSEISNCFRKINSEEREMCIYSYAIYNTELTACSHAGSRADRCLLNLAVAKKDALLCQQISAGGYRDDCYIEIAGIHKNSSLCSSITNQTKLQACTDIAGGG